MEALALHTVAPTVNWEYNISCISVVESKMVNTRVKHINIPVYFLPEQFDNGNFIPEYEKYNAIINDMCTKPCPGPIISCGNKWMTGLRLYPTSDTKNYQLMILYGFVVN